MRDLRVNFGAVEAVRGVSFDVPEHRTVALVGESGSGKSVTALATLRLLHRATVSGEIQFRGRDLLRLQEREMRALRGAEISMVFQEPMSSLNPVFTAGFQIAEALRAHHRVSRVNELLEEVGLSADKAGRYPHELSGGEQQRVMIAMAVACEPKLLIADEPTSALDVTVQKQILELIAELQRRRRMSVLFITHDLALVRAVADDVVVMRAGEVRERGSVQDVFAVPRDDYTRMLLAARPAPRTRNVPQEKVVLEARGLAKSYDGVQAVKGASFKVAKGRTLGVVGESGSGKTTLGLMVARLREPSSGGIFLDGQDATAVPAKRFKRRIQVVFQNPYASLNPRHSIGETLTEPMRIHGIGASDSEREQRAATLLAKVGLNADALRRYPHEFSGGQRQRIAIARALTLEPEVVICDEAVSALDVSVQAQLLRLLQDLQDEYAMSYLFISHDLAVVKAMADDVMVMKDGEIVEMGPAREVYAAPKHPYTRTLLSSALALALLLVSPHLWAAHAYSQFGDIKYPPGFKHFEWVNPDAPKGGDIELVPPLRITNFDKYNPFTLKGTAPPGTGLLFESMLTGTMDEPTTAYGLLAEDVDVPADGMSVTFRINPAARFHDGSPVMAADAKHSFDMLMSKQAAPQYRVIYSEIKQTVIVGPRTIRYEFKRPNAELPLMAGGLPVFSRAWGAGKPFDQVVMDMPIATGPYKIGRLNFGRDITYVRDPNYWAKDLNVRRGRYNFDRITYKIYKDTTAQTEAFKAGEFDYLRTFSAREWARTYVGKKFDSGELIKQELPFKNAGDFQGFLINTRRDKFKDPRVREALGLAFDFEWMNRQMMYNSYIRVRGFFNASDFEAKGLPGEDELKVLEPLRKQLPPRVFKEDVPLPASTNPPGSLRDNLRKARDLLAAAGWNYRDGALRNAKGEPFVIEYLDSGGGERLVAPYFQALGKLGIAGEYRRADFALIRKRLDVFDFDIFTVRIPGSEAPGAELLDRFGSESADTEGSSNLMGIKDPAIDALVNSAVGSKTRPELVARLRALDRVLRHHHFVIPQWYSGSYRIAYRAGKFEQPKVMPLYYQAEDWVISTWWRKP